ncbi:MAG: tetratricopeptide repeat protein, partial [Dokdonella sp.]
MLLCALAILGARTASAQPSPEPYVDAARRTQDLANLVTFGVTPLLDLAGQLFGPRIEFEGRRELGLVFLALDSIEPARDSWSRVEELATRLNDENGLVQALEILGDLDLQAGDSESARLSSDRLAAFATTRGEPGLDSAALRLRGVARRREGRLDAALEDLQNSVAKARAAHSEELLGDALNALGSLYRDQGDFANALEAHLQARDTRLASGYRLDTTYRNIALLYREIDDQAMVRDYLDKALTISVKQGNAFGLAPILGSQAAVLNDQGEFATALDSASQAALADEMSGHRSSIGFNLVESGRALVGLGRIDEAILKLQAGLAAGRESGVREVVARALLPMAGIAMRRDDAASAQRHLDEAGAVLEDARLLPQLIEFYALSEQLAASKGDFPAQLVFAKRHAEQRELMLGVRASRQLAELKVRNSRLAGDQALEGLRSRNELQGTRLRMQSLEQKITWYGIFALALLAVIGAWRYTGIRR